MGVHVGKEGIIINAARAISPCMSRDIYAPIPSRIIVDSKMVQAIKIFAESLRKVCGLHGDTLSVSFVSDTVPMSEEEKKIMPCHDPRMCGLGLNNTRRCGIRVISWLSERE